ncbi:hypothetical protein I4F81_000689 [Pyropia yezoensis]|uniref:Uncharacterized protein n=1 Tax=Pyropia yezoensis TaxID=2788 RepID=A0ACC3BJE6_PYRYE|nr:hypothetical protein I4F81_000689 [Neopyropia yezoensis]
MADEDVSVAENQLYLQFFKHLGITDELKTGFLAPLLRNVFDASSKFDSHLAPYGATVHTAVSRLLVSDNPRNAPCYRWIRIVDRVGLFSDDDAHAVRLINICLSYAYRFVEADALAVANAALLGQTRTSTVRGPAPVIPQPRAPAGTTSDAPSVESAPQIPAEEPSIPAGGAVVARNTSQGVGDGKDARTTAGGAREKPLENGGVVVSGASGANPGGDADPSAGGQDDDADDAADAEDGAPSYIVYERQPCIVPSTTAVDTVASVLRTVCQRNDATAKDVLRKLLTDSLLCLVRSQPGAKLATGSAVVAGGCRQDWAAVNARTDRWWPRWRAPELLGRMEAPSNTFAGVVNRGRVAKSSRWIVLVNMSGIKESVEKLSVRSSRFFPKMQLPDEEPVLRVHYHKPLRLTSVLASMLLFATKEEQFLIVLARLAADGRAPAPASSSMASGGRHEFFSSGFPASAVAVAPSPGPASARPKPGVSVERAALPPSDKPRDLAGRIAEVKAALSVESVQEAAINRRKRIKIMRAKAAARLQASSQVPSRSGRPQSSPTGSTTPGSEGIAAPLEHGLSAGLPPTPATAPSAIHRAARGTSDGRAGGARELR